MARDHEKLLSIVVGCLHTIARAHELGINDWQIPSNALYFAFMTGNDAFLTEVCQTTTAKLLVRVEDAAAAQKRAEAALKLRGAAQPTPMGLTPPEGPLPGTDNQGS